MKSALALCLAIAACSSKHEDRETHDHHDADASPAARNVAAWIEDKSYLTWSCEPEPHAARGTSEHGINRICSNDTLAASADGFLPPVGSASVKELYDEAGTTIIGYAAAVRTSEGNSGDSWYWYERGERKHAGEEGGAESGMGLGECVSCHTAAPTPFVWAKVARPATPAL